MQWFATLAAQENYLGGFKDPIAQSIAQVS